MPEVLVSRGLSARSRLPLPLDDGESVDGGQHALGRDGEDRGVGLGGERLAAADARVREDDVRPRRRTPFLRRRRAEEHDGRHRVGARQVRDAGVGRDDDPGVGDDRRRLRQVQDAREHGASGEPGALRDRSRALDVRSPARDDDVQAALGETPGDGREPLDGPLPGAVEGADVHDGRTSDDGRGIRTSDRDVVRVRLDAEGGHQAHPARALEQAVAPHGRSGLGVGRALLARAAVTEDVPRAERGDEGRRLAAGAVEVHGDVDETGRERQRIVEPLRGQQRVGVGQRHDRLEPAGHREHQFMLREGPSQSADRGDRDEQVAELQRPEGEQHGSVAGAVEDPHAAHPAEARAIRRAGPPAAVLFDRDGTLVVDVPYNGDPALVAPMPTAAAAVALLVARGIPTGVVTNQSGVARGLITRAEADAVNARVDELLGPFGVWCVCPHGADDGCACRKPAPGMVLDAARRLGVDPGSVAVIGDIAADLGAAAAAGARGVLVPTTVTRPEEVQAAPETAATLEDAVRLLLGMPDAPDAHAEAAR